MQTSVPPTTQLNTSPDAVQWHDVYVRRDGKLTLETVSAFVVIDGKRVTVDLEPVHEGTHFHADWKGVL